MSAEVSQGKVAAIAPAALVRPGLGPRIPVELAVSYSWQGSKHSLTATGIGAGGMHVTGASAPPEATVLQFSVRLPGRAEAVRLPGVALRAPDGALEVRFTDAREAVRTLFRVALIDAFPHSIEAARLRVDARATEDQGARPSSGMLSVVVPVYDEGEIIETFHRELVDALATIGVAYEIIYVNDGSTDDTQLRLQGLAGPSTRIISLSRNFGHQAAVVAGLEASSGTAVITIDGDLQQPPSLISELVGKWREGYDVVNTVRRPDRKLGLLKRVTSRMFYALFSLLSALELPPGAADFRLLDRRVVDILLSFRERHFFLRGLVHWIGFRGTYLDYSAAPRRAGESKFTLRKMLRLASDGLFAFSTFPLRLVLYLGLLSLVVTFFVVLYVAYAQIRHLQVPGWSSLLLILSFFSGLQMLGLGVVAEYVGRIFAEAKMRPRHLASLDDGRDDVVFRALADLAVGSS